MVTISMRHKVSDYAAWKQVFDDAREIRRSAGEVACRVYTAHGQPDDVLVAMDWESLDKARAFLSSPRLMEGMAKAGVRELPQIVMLERRDEYRL